MELDYIFTSRRDVEALMLIIQEWQKAHKRDEKAEYADELFDKLDYLHMVW